MPSAPSASPKPSPSSANAACVRHTSRSAMFVVAIEHECGKRGIAGDAALAQDAR